MNKMLNPRRGGFQTSKITDYEEEEFPLYTDGDSLFQSGFNNSEMRSLMSGRKDERNSTI
jgi:hypothetical protein|tara:strand:+ start:584 stop:763 length:180 start_codon:yes stop_codon:yes gene_type:complete